MEESESIAGDIEGIIDLLFSRYQSSAKVVLGMPYEDALSLIQRAVQEQYEERLWQRWIAGPQHFIAFEEFRKELEKPDDDQDDGKTVEEIMQKVESILNGTYEVEDNEDI